jgi:Clostridium P-47 protein
METFGWDTVYVVTTDEINTSLASNKDKLIMSFDTEVTSELPLKATGNFTNWEIVAGGSGAILYLKMAIADGNVTFTDTKQTVDLSGTSLVVAVQLALLPKTDTPNLEELRFKLTQVGEIGTPPAPGTITPVTLQGANGKLDVAQSALLMISLASYIIAKAETLNYVFATVNLVPPATDSWLTPVRSAYMYLNRIGASGAMAILSVTTNREISFLPLQVDAALLSPAYDASFGISKELFLRNVIQPALPAVFGHGASAESFVFDKATASIKNTVTLDMNGIKKAAITYYPQILSLNMTTTGSGLASNYAGNCDMRAGISLKFWVDPRNDSIYDSSTKTIDFIPDSNPSSRTDVDIPWYWWFLGPLVRGITELIVQAIASSIASSLTLDIGKFMTIAKNPPTSVQWNGTESIDVRAASLNVGFYMQGMLRAIRRVEKTGVDFDDVR